MAGGDANKVHGGYVLWDDVMGWNVVLHDESWFLIIAVALWHSVPQINDLLALFYQRAVLITIDWFGMPLQQPGIASFVSLVSVVSEVFPSMKEG